VEVSEDFLQVQVDSVEEASAAVAAEVLAVAVLGEAGKIIEHE